MPQSGSSATARRRWSWRTSLFWNHMDAWQVATIIAALPLLFHDLITWRTLSLLLAIGLGYWYAFALNDYFDADQDALDPRKRFRNFFAAAPPGSYRRFMLLLGMVVVAIETSVFIQFGLPGIFILILSTFIMWAYSAPPLRLESRAGLDLFTHVFFVQTYVYVIVMLLIRAPWGLADGIIITILLLTSLTAQLEQQLRDFNIDAQTRRTVTFVLGQRWTRRILIGATAAAVLIGFTALIEGTLPLLMLAYGLISLPALLHRLTRAPQTPRSERLVLTSTSVAFLYTAGLLIWLALS